MNKFKETVASLRAKHRLLFNLALIALVILVLAVASHWLMQFGTRHNVRLSVPDFSGIPLDEAQRIAKKNDLKIHINDSLFVPAYEGGIVLDQLPEGGVEVKPGRTIYITINSFREKMVPVPFVAGYSLRQAKNMLEIGGLEIERLVYQPDLATNYVLEEFCKQKPVLEHSRMEAEMGSGVTLHVGVEAENNRTGVPMLVGLSLKDAKSHLWEAGLNVGKIEFDEGINLLNQKNARVYEQTPTARRGLALGSEVSFRLTLDEKKVSSLKTKAEAEAQKVAEQERRLEMERQDSLNLLMIDSLRRLQLADPEEQIPSDPVEETPKEVEQTDNDSFFD